MFYPVLDPNPFRLFGRLPGVHFRAQAGAQPEAGEAEETAAWSPAVDVLETPEAFRLFCELPGAGPDDLELKVEKTSLTVSGQVASTVEGDGAAVVRHERRNGKFARSFVLPSEVDASKIQAVFKAGVLEITLPKSSDVKPRKIKITGA